LRIQSSGGSRRVVKTVNYRPDLFPGGIPVERTFAWLNRQRRLLVRFDRLASQYLGFLHLGCALVCWSYLTKS